METNTLYPIFLKVRELNVLIIGAGKVGTEKLHFLLKSSPDANVEVVANWFSDELLSFAANHNVILSDKDFDFNDLNQRSIVIAATNNRALNEQIYAECRLRNVLVNVADNPDLCDFYLGGIVTKQNLKIAISTNGKSPTLAKRMRQYFEQEIPDDVNGLLENLSEYRSQLKGDFELKLNALNELTKNLINN